MSMRIKAVLVGVLVAVLTTHFGIRSAFGRHRPDLTAWVSFDDGLWAYQHTFRDGSVGPLTVGQSRSSARKKLENLHLFDHDRRQIAKPAGDWRIASPAGSGGYVIYTVQFDADRVASVKSYYSVFAGL